MRASMRSSARCCASPSMPPNPPTRIGTGCATICAVRPASEMRTSRSARLASAPASSRASVVPPRMRIRRAMSPPDSPLLPAGPGRWLAIVGIGEDGVDGLGIAARDEIQKAEVVFGGRRHLALAAPLVRGTSRPWPSPFERAVDEVLAERGRPVCVLASGDPFQYGIGPLLARRVASGEWCALPGVSAFSLAAARLGWSLPETALVSLHGRALDRIRPHLFPAARLLALTSDADAPR